MTKVINLFAGPGAGKSSTAAHLFAEMKWMGINCELATEYVKEKVWAKNFEILKYQPYILGKQYYRIAMLQGMVDYVITDSPILLAAAYTDDPETVKYAVHLFNEFDNYNFFLKRKKEYNENGRMQTLEEAKKLDLAIHNLLWDNDVHPVFMEGSREGVQIILSRLGLLK